MKMIINCLNNVLQRFMLKFRRYGGIFALHYRGGEVTMLKERFKKILINLGLKIVKYLDISICLSVCELLKFLSILQFLSLRFIGFF